MSGIYTSSLLRCGFARGYTPCLPESRGASEWTPTHPRFLTDSPPATGRISISVYLNDNESVVLAKVDTGAPVTLIPESFALEIGVHNYPQLNDYPVRFRNQTQSKRYKAYSMPICLKSDAGGDDLVLPNVTVAVVPNTSFDGDEQCILLGMSACLSAINFAVSLEADFQQPYFYFGNQAD